MSIFRSPNDSTNSAFFNLYWKQARTASTVERKFVASWKSSIHLPSLKNFPVSLLRIMRRMGFIRPMSKHHESLPGNQWGVSCHLKHTPTYVSASFPARVCLRDLPSASDGPFRETVDNGKRRQAGRKIRTEEGCCWREAGKAMTPIRRAEDVFSEGTEAH
jgi:hypothetical protein